MFYSVLTHLTSVYVRDSDTKPCTIWQRGPDANINFMQVACTAFACQDLSLTSLVLMQIARKVILVAARDPQSTKLKRFV